ncbi:TolB-like translocation protein [Ferruginibacter albus]|uniref:hypothetical protein n=1 Tax=Ferruginibacter albus TaxID=2875540 RepID=UPI001CC5CC76|nr:hypothetical protein [Ferruginibacter albus]UAY51666.1 hypothetical protein K9M53_13850 [Ferruginibacter albus]
MKKLLLGSFILLFFAAALAIVEVSCSKNNVYGDPITPSHSTTILFAKFAYSVQGIDTTYSGSNLFVCNSDGSNVRQIPIPLPASSIITPFISGIGIPPHLTPNGDSVIFQASSGNPYYFSIYKCALDGTGLITIASGTGSKAEMPILCDVK